MRPLRAAGAANCSHFEDGGYTYSTRELFASYLPFVNTLFPCSPSDVALHKGMETMPSKRILVVDDEPTVRALCSRILLPLGFSVDTVESADEAFDLIIRNRYDLVLTDCKMPGKWDGLMLGRAVKEHMPSVQLIVMTAFPAVDSAVETLRLGAVDYLIKPFDSSELVRRVQLCLDPSSHA
jgi:DNA-binding NtrC family response regulator